MNEAKELLDKWLDELGLKTYKELASFLNVAQNTLDVWKQRGKIPEKHILKYTQMKTNTNCKIFVPDIINAHLSTKEIEILQAYRELDKEDQEIFYHKLKAAAAEARKKAKENNSNVLQEDVKSAV